MYQRLRSERSMRLWHYKFAYPIWNSIFHFSKYLLTESLFAEKPWAFLCVYFAWSNAFSLNQHDKIICTDHQPFYMDGLYTTRWAVLIVSTHTLSESISIHKQYNGHIALLVKWLIEWAQKKNACCFVEQAKIIFLWMECSFFGLCLMMNGTLSPDNLSISFFFSTINTQSVWHKKVTWDMLLTISNLDFNGIGVDALVLNA